MTRSQWYWAHTVCFLAHGIYMAAGAGAFVVSSQQPMGNFEEKIGQCDSASVVHAWGSAALAMVAGVISLVLFTAICRWDKGGGPMTPELFDGSSFAIKVGWIVRLLLAWAEYYLAVSTSRQLHSCWVMRAPFLLGGTAALSQLVVILADYAKWMADRRSLDEVLAPDLPDCEPGTPVTPATGIPIPVLSSRFTDRLVEV